MIFIHRAGGVRLLRRRTHHNDLQMHKRLLQSSMKQCFLTLVFDVVFWVFFVSCFLEKQLIYQFHLCSHPVSVQFIISMQVYNLALFKLHSIFKESCLQFVKTPSNSYVHQHFCSSCQVSTVSRFCLYTLSFIIQVKALNNISQDKPCGNGA